MLTLERVARLCASAAAALVLAGCSVGPRPSVAGKVHYDGQSVDLGSIAFIPLEEGGGRTSATGPIRGGHYEIDSQTGPMPGKYRVEIHWRKKTGNKVPGEGDHPRDEIVDGIPDKYNTESELTADVQPGRNTFHFDLKK